LLIEGANAMTGISYRCGGRTERTRALLVHVETSVESFRFEVGRYPRELPDLVTCPSDVDPTKWPPGGFLKKLPKDGWDREFIYRRPGTRGQPYDLISYGEDGREGGEGYAEDLWSHEAGRR
jgi:general secretion pathway protein G